MVFVKKRCVSSYLDKLNKLWEYIEFNKNDKVIGEYIDYFAFYGKRYRKTLITLLASDNWGAYYFKRFTIKQDTVRWFQAKVFFAYMGVAVDMFQIKEITIWNEVYLKVDLYWKGIKLIREQLLRNDLYLFLSEVLCMKDIVITRTDYTVDCAKYNFRKVNKLSNRVSWSISSIWHRDRDLDNLNWKVEKFNKNNKNQKKTVQYKLFWKKSSSSARFIRYYDKKAEILARGTAFLYPEYFWYDNIMRYELQCNSKGFDPIERNITIKEIESFINFGYCVPSSTVSHKPKRDESIYKWVAWWIRKLKREWFYEDIEKIKMLLIDYQDLVRLNEKWDID